MWGGDIGGNERRKGESKDGGEFMILNTTYCRRAFTGVYCEHMDGNVLLDNPASVSFSTERVDDEKMESRRNWILI